MYVGVTITCLTGIGLADLHGKELRFRWSYARRHAICLTLIEAKGLYVT
jgi:hypothetical protein